MTTEEVDLLNKTGMTDKEKELISMTVDLWNKYMQLPETHPTERGEFASKIHDIQNLIASRHVFGEINQAHYSFVKNSAGQMNFPLKPIPPADRQIKEGGDLPYVVLAGGAAALCACLMAVCKIWGWGWLLTFAIVCFYIDKESYE